MKLFALLFSTTLFASVALADKADDVSSPPKC